jgi:serine/threonine protein phosphatase PrpC
MQKAKVMFETGAITHVGKVRKRNEDSYLARPDAGIWAVADGMGGHESGDLASQTVIEALGAIERPMSAEDLLQRCADQVANANERLKSISCDRGGITIGATVAALLTYDAHYACVWSGDSRIYLVRAGQITQLSRDHTEVQELLSQGAITPNEAKTWPGRNIITRAIGVFDEPELEVRSGPLHPGDSFVICSDGLTQHVEDAEILSCVGTNLSQQACERLLELTLERGAVDNVTVIVVRYDPGAMLLTRSDAEPPDVWELPG